MATRTEEKAKANAKAKVDYSFLERFTELLICSRCFQKKLRQPIRQLVSRHHRPLVLCHDCAREEYAEHRAPVFRLKRQFHY